MQHTLRYVFLPRPSRAWRRPTAASTIVSTLAQWRQRSRSRRELARLDARQLADVGLTPGDQFRECAKPFWQA